MRVLERSDEDCIGVICVGDESCVILYDGCFFDVFKFNDVVVNTLRTQKDVVTIRLLILYSY